MSNACNSPFRHQIQWIFFSGKVTLVKCMRLKFSTRSHTETAVTLVWSLSLKWYRLSPWTCFNLLEVFDRNDAIKTLRQYHLVV